MTDQIGNEGEVDMVFYQAEKLLSVSNIDEFFDMLSKKMLTPEQTSLLIAFTDESSSGPCLKLRYLDLRRLAFLLAAVDADTQNMLITYCLERLWKKSDCEEVMLFVRRMDNALVISHKKEIMAIFCNNSYPHSVEFLEYLREIESEKLDVSK